MINNATNIETYINCIINAIINDNIIICLFIDIKYQILRAYITETMTWFAILYF